MLASRLIVMASRMASLEFAWNRCVRVNVAQAPVSCTLCGEVFIIESLPRRSQVAGGGVIGGPLARSLIWRT